MFYTMLVTIGEGSGAMEDFLGVVRKHYGHGLEDFFDLRPPYVMIERIPYGAEHASYRQLLDELDSTGCTVWLVMEPTANGHAEVCYCRVAARTNGLQKLDHFISLPMMNA